MFYSLQQAADVVGVNKSTVLRAIQAGKVPATRNKRDQWLIEPAKLRRVYPPAAAGNGKVKHHGNAHQSELAEANRRVALWSELKVSSSPSQPQKVRLHHDDAFGTRGEN